MARMFLLPVKRFRLGAMWLIVCLLAGSAVGGGPFTCEAPIIWSQQFARSESLVFVRFVQTHDRVKDKQAFTVFEIVEVLRDPRKSLKVGARIDFPEWVNSKPGNFALLMESRQQGTRSASPQWSLREPMTREALRYIREAPTPDAKNPERLDYFAKFLEHPDEIIATDAFEELTAAPPEHVIRVARKFSPDKLRKWVFETEGGRAMVRRGLYAMMLGLCGDKSDVPRFEAIIRENPEDEIRLGMGDMITGYLFLTGSDGLKIVERAKFLTPNIHFTETYGAMVALRFMWTYGEGWIPAERLRESLRLLLDNPELAEIAISDLTRWKDWTVQPRLVKLYGGGGDNAPATKRAIIRFMLASTYDLPNEATAPVPEGRLPPHVLRGREALQIFRKQDPELVESAEKYFRPKGSGLKKTAN